MQPTIIKLGGPEMPVQVETFEDAYSNVRGRGRARRTEKAKQRGKLKAARQEKKTDKIKARQEKRAARKEMHQAHKDERVSRKLGRKEAKLSSRLARKAARKASRQMEDDTLPDDEMEDLHPSEANVTQDQYQDDTSGNGYNSGYRDDNAGYASDEDSYDDSEDGYEDDYEEGNEGDDDTEDSEEESGADGATEGKIPGPMQEVFEGEMSFTPAGRDDIQEMAFSNANGKNKKRGKSKKRRNRKTIIRNVENPIISPNKIVVPSEEASGANYGADGSKTGLIGLDDHNDFDAPEERTIYLNAEGSGKSIAGVSIKSIVIGSTIGLGLIWAINKSGILKKK